MRKRGKEKIKRTKRRERRERRQEREARGEEGVPGGEKREEERRGKGGERRARGEEAPRGGDHDTFRRDHMAPPSPSFTRFSARFPPYFHTPTRKALSHDAPSRPWVSEGRIHAQRKQVFPSILTNNVTLNTNSFFALLFLKPFAIFMGIFCYFMIFFVFF